MEIAKITDGLLDRVKAVPELNNRVGLVLGGKNIDPLNHKLDRPASWVIFLGDIVNEPDQLSTCSVMTNVSYTIKVLIDYNTEQQLIDTDLQLLYSIVSSVQGFSPVAGSSFSYQGMNIIELSADRIVWDINFSILVAV